MNVHLFVRVQREKDSLNLKFHWMCSSSLIWKTMEGKRMSDARVGALAVTAICSISTLIAFCTPNWLASDRRLYGANFVKLGLWETCFRSFRSPDDDDLTKYYSGCRWIFAEEYQNIRYFLMPCMNSFTYKKSCH